MVIIKASLWYVLIMLMKQKTSWGLVQSSFNSMDLFIKLKVFEPLNVFIQTLQKSD